MSRLQRNSVAYKAAAGGLAGVRLSRRLAIIIFRVVGLPYFPALPVRSLSHTLPPASLITASSHHRLWLSPYRYLSSVQADERRGRNNMHASVGFSGSHHQISGLNTRVIKCEVQRVISVLRSHQASTEARFVEEIPTELESPLLRSFRALYARLHSTAADALDAHDAAFYISPFCAALVAGDVSGVVAGVSLAALNKFLLYGFLSVNAPGAATAVNRIVGAATQCRFEPTSASEDELVLLRLLELLGNALRAGAGVCLTDDSVWDAVQCAFLISRIDRGSHLLRRSGENTLEAIVTHVFSRAHEFAETAAGASDAPSDATTPYGVPVLTRVLSWLAGLADPAAHGRSTRALGLELLTMVLETGGEGLARAPGCVVVCQAQVCRSLIANARSPDPAVLALVLRTVYSMFASSSSLKQHLKVQLEVFLTSVHLFLADATNAPPLSRELALESLLDFTREPGLLLDLYCNFDCDISCANLFELLARCLCRNATRKTSTSPLNSLNSIALEGVLTMVGSMAKRVSESARSRVVQEGGLAAEYAEEEPGDSSFVGAAACEDTPSSKRTRPPQSSDAGDGDDADWPAVLEEPYATPAATPESSSRLFLDAITPQGGHVFTPAASRRLSDVGVDGADMGTDSPSATALGRLSAPHRAFSSVRVARPHEGGSGDDAASTPQRSSAALNVTFPGAMRLAGDIPRDDERAAILRARHNLKRRMALAAEKFSSGAKDWLAFAVGEGVITSIDDEVVSWGCASSAPSMQEIIPLTPHPTLARG